MIIHWWGVTNFQTNQTNPYPYPSVGPIYTTNLHGSASGTSPRWLRSLTCLEWKAGHGKSRDVVNGMAVAIVHSSNLQCMVVAQPLLADDFSSEVIL